MKDAALANHVCNRLEIGRCDETILPLRFLRPRVGEKERKVIDLTRTKHERESFGVSSEKKKIIEFARNAFFGPAKDLLKFPINSNIGIFRILRGEFEDHMSCVTADLDV